MPDQTSSIIRLANGKSFSASNEMSILSAAMQNDIALEYSCKMGRCGVCKAQVLSGQSNCLEAETGLTDEEASSGFILTCCRAAGSDLELDIEDLGDLAKYKVKTVPARIDTIQQLSPDVVRVVLRTPPRVSLAFRAGQYVDIIGPKGIRRSYSIANAPREDGKLSFEIRRVEGGVLSEYWFCNAAINDLLRLEGPFGTFCRRSNLVNNLILLATGTGIAPVKAILEEIAEFYDNGKEAYKNIYLYWGGRMQEDIYWTPEFGQLPLEFIPVLSRVKKWGGRTGYVQSAVLSDQLSLAEAEVYACGSEAMIYSAKAALIKSGLPPKRFYSDAFVCSS